MLLPATIDRPTVNTSGGCKLQLVPAAHIAVFPDEINGTVPEEIELIADTVWYTILPTRWTQAFDEQWLRDQGAQHAVAELACVIPRDRAELLQGLWELHHGRFVVLHHDLNQSIKVMGTKLEPARVHVDTLKHGDRPGGDRNQYELRVRVSRRVECPFYLADPPVPGVPGDCPTLEQQLSTADWDDDIQPNLSSQQLTDAQAAICDCPTLAEQLSTADWDDDIQPNLSSQQLTDAEAALCDSCDDASYTLQDHLGNDISTGNIAAGAHADIEAPPAIVRSEDVDPEFTFPIPSGSALTLPYVRILDYAGNQIFREYQPTPAVIHQEQLQLYFDFQASAGQIAITMSAAAVFSIEQHDGSSGTIEYRINAGSWNTFGASVTVAASDSLQVRRSNTASAGWVQITTAYP